MYIRDILKEKKPSLSFEIFPPKPDVPVDRVYSTLEKLNTLSPDYISVTYGAGGSNSDRMMEIATTVQGKMNQTALAHFTCVGASRESVESKLIDMQEAGIKNILALRGDIPVGMDASDAFTSYRYASDLVKHIKSTADMSIGVAAYPEIHYASDDRKSDIDNLKIKVDSGADFIVTQMFFDNDVFFEFRDIAKKAGITVPMVTGIMPVLDATQILRMTKMSGCSIPSKLSRMFARYERDNESMREAGLDYCIEQINQLIDNDVDGVHIYSMNKWEATTKIVNACGLR